MKRLCALLLLLPLLVALPVPTGRAQSGRPGALADAGPAQTVTICRQALADPEVSATQASPWRSFGSGWALSTAQSSSAPQSLSLSASGAAGGQVITLTATLEELYGSLSYYYAGGSVAPNDELRVQLYEVANNSLGNLITTAAVLTGTGRVEGSWQTFGWEVLDAASISRLRTLGRAALVFSAVRAAGPGAQQLWLDDLTASTCVPAASLSGRVTQGAENLAEALVVLAHTSAGGATSVAASTRTAPDGTYRLLSVPALAAGESYRVWFLNKPPTPPSAPGLLGFWAGPRLGTLAAGQSIANLDFNVAGVGLLSPASYSEVVVSEAAPAVLRWSGRSTGGERHRACIYDPARADQGTRLPLTYCGPAIDPSREALAFTLRPGDLPASFGFTYGRSYRWYVEVYDRSPSDPEAQYGYSFAERAITLLSAPSPAPPAAPPLEPGEPAAGVSSAEWTLLIYMAADNAIGDPNQVPNLGRPSGQLASLPELAADYTRVNLVSYVDRYEPDGIELCVYPPGAEPDCRARAEANTADPSTLAAFIAYGRQRYPATHTALLIVAPGQAAGQLALDESAPGGPAMSLAGLDTAYQAAGLGGPAKLDLVIYQAPLLGSVEALQATAPYARYMVASAGQVWQLGPYRQLVPVLAGLNRFDVAAVAREVVAAYGTTTAVVGGARATSWAAYDLGRAAALGGSIDALAGDIQAALSSEESVMRPALADARARAQSYDSSGNGRLDALEASAGAVAAEEDCLVDLRDIAAQLRGAAGVPAYVQQAAGNLITLLDSPATSPVIASAIRSGQSIAADPIDLGRARGLAVFFPGGDRLGGGATLTESYHSADPPSGSVWADMLRTYQGRRLAVGPGGVTEGAAGGAQFRPLPGGFVSTTLYLPLARR